MLKPRKIPLRMCVGCRNRDDKRNLIRVVRTPEQEVVVDPTGKRAGRGAYICPATSTFSGGIDHNLLFRCTYNPD